MNAMPSQIVGASSVECNGVSNHQPHDCSLKRLFRRRLHDVYNKRMAETFFATDNYVWPAAVDTLTLVKT